jgi:hypothetical protein
MGQEKKLEIKAMRTKLKIIIPSIWIEWRNWKPIKLLQKSQDQKLKIKKIRTEVEMPTNQGGQAIIFRVEEREKKNSAMIYWITTKNIHHTNK